MCDSKAQASPRPSDDDAVITDAPMADHLQAVRSHHRFPGVARCGVPWELSHLEPFAFRVDPGLGFEVTVVVLFSCHCFTRSLARDGRTRLAIPSGELFDDGREVRVLCEERYELSRRHLPHLIKDLRKRSIQIARDHPPNYVTSVPLDDTASLPRRYVVFFEVSRDNKRKGRLILQVQSGYVIEDAPRGRLRARRKISFLTLLRATALRRRISG